jgi:hypothetical protein
MDDIVTLARGSYQLRISFPSSDISGDGKNQVIGMVPEVDRVNVCRPINHPARASREGNPRGPVAIFEFTQVRRLQSDASPGRIRREIPKKKLAVAVPSRCPQDIFPY